MARPLRIEYPGALYHITSRGDRGERIYENDADRMAFLQTLERVVERFRWVCHAYCLMGNHYHLLVETPEPNLSRGMRQLNGVYTQNHNRRHRKTGHVFQGRYKSVLIQKESHLLEVSRYVVLNPVRAGLVERAEQWRWSSYGATAGLSQPPPFLTTDWLLAQFGEKRDRAQSEYRRFVREGTGESPVPWEELVGGFLLGDEAFIARCQALVEKSRPRQDLSRVERYVGRPTLEELFAQVSPRDRGARDPRVSRAYLDHGYTMKEIADFLGLHYTTISVIIHRAEGDTL